MDPLLLGAGLLGGGAALSGISGLLGASSGNRAGRQARDWYDRRTGEGAGRLGVGLWGYDPYSDLVLSSDASKSAADQKAGADRFNAATGGPIMGQLRELGALGEAGSAAIGSGYDLETGRLGLLGRGLTGQLMDAYRKGTDATLGSYDQGAGALMSGLEKWGVGREKIIERDAAKQERNMNDASKAALYSAGLGNSTAVANQLSSNARNVGEAKQNALQTLSESKIDRTTSLGRSTLGERFGAQVGLLSSGLGALERGLQTNLGNEYARSGGKTQLDTQGLERSIQLRQLPLQTALGSLTGNVMNPWLGQNTSQYFPGYSGLGSATQGIGNAAGSMGSMLLLQGLMKKAG